jgi:hypothetical protein
MMRIFNKYIRMIALLAISAIAMTSCNDFLDINDDPNNPTSVDLSLLLASAETNLAFAIGSTAEGGINAYAGTTVQHFNQRGTRNDYGLLGGDFTIAVVWSSIYQGALTDLEEVIRIGTEAEEFGYVGRAQALKAWAYASMVDVWGDIPYFEANLGSANTAPVYDGGELIYDDLLNTVLVAAEANILAGASSVSGDLMYADASGWVKMINALRLKMYTNMRLKRDVSASVNALGATFTSMADDFEFAYGTSLAPENRNPGFVQEWAAGGSNYQVDPYIFELMTSRDTYGHGGLQFGVDDPRLPYYFFNQLPNGAADSDAENPCDYCPSRTGTGFLSIWPFSFNISPNEGFDQSSSRTLAGLYAVGGRYDDGLGGVASNASTLGAGQVTGPASTPQRLISYDEVLYMRAELAQASVTGGNARSLLSDAIDASFAKVGAVASSAGAPALVSADATAWRDAVLAAYDAAADPMEIIMTAKWLAMVGNSSVSYNDIRRTGYPRLHDGNTDNLSFTVQTRTFPVSFPYDENNLILNSNSPNQRVIALDKVWWDN